MEELEELKRFFPPARSAQIVICRDIPGEHVGGPGCWCNPYVVDARDEVAVQRALELAKHPERQVE